MNRLYFILLINIFFYLSSVSPAQVDYLELYKEFFPQSEFKNKSEEDNFNEVLSSLAAVNPDLLYYYFEHFYHLKYLHITNPDSNFSSILNYKIKISREKKSDWAKFQLKNIDERIDLRIKRNKMASYIDDFILSPQNIKIPDFILPVDSNKLNYINFIYYSNSSKEKYDNKTNYFEICKASIKRLVDMLNKQVDEFDKLSKSEKIEFIEEATNYWELLDTKNNNRYNIATNFELYELLIKTFDDDFKTNSAFLFEANVHLNTDEIIFERNFPYEAQYFTGGSVLFNFQPMFRLKPMFDIGIGYKLKLREENTIFSYVDFKIFYVKSNTARDDTLRNMVILESSGIKPNEWRFTQEVVLSDITNLKHNSFGAGLYTPVFYFWRDAFIELGLFTTYNILSYDFNVTNTITYTYLNGDPTTYEQTIDPFSYKEEKFVVNGALAINIQPIKQWLTRVELLTDFSWRLGVRYNLEF